MKKARIWIIAGIGAVIILLAFLFIPNKNTDQVSDQQYADALHPDGTAMENDNSTKPAGNTEDEADLNVKDDQENITEKKEHHHKCK